LKSENRIKIDNQAACTLLDKKWVAHKSSGLCCRLNQGKFKEDFTRLFQINSASRLDKTSWGFL
jgi:hypothetical protein